MKKIIVFTLILFTIFGLVACKDEVKEPAKPAIDYYCVEYAEIYTTFNGNYYKLLTNVDSKRARLTYQVDDAWFELNGECIKVDDHVCQLTFTEAYQFEKDENGNTRNRRQIEPISSYDGFISGKFTKYRTEILNAYGEKRIKKGVDLLVVEDYSPTSVLVGMNTWYDSTMSF